MFSSTIELFQTSPAYFYSVVFIFSLLIGSFLNVVIYRLPRILEQNWKHECRDFLADELPKDHAKNMAKTDINLTLSKPNSQCPKCQHNIRFYENIPVISWLFLKGKCSQCKNSISIRYPVIELATAVLATVLAYHYGASITLVFALILTYGLICLTLIDYDHMLLPDQITLPLLWLGLLVNTAGIFVPLQDAVIGAASGYFSLFAIFWLFKLITGKEGMGYGDFKLFAMFGAWIGWQLLPVLILMASIVGAVVGIGMVVFGNHDKQKPIPFGPYLAIAGWITLLWGNTIWQWYLSTLNG